MLLILRPPRSPLFPYTTLFRSQHRAGPHDVDIVGDLERPFDVLIDEKDRLPLRRQVFDRLVDDGRHPWLDARGGRSEEHTSELQSHSDLVCRLLLEKKNKNTTK